MAVDLKIKSVPNKMASATAKATAGLVSQILDKLGYSGVWQLGFSAQLRQKSQAKFKCIRRDGNGIRIRTKPGSNDTCWESVIVPPQGILAQDVAKDLRQVHPQKLVIPRPRTNPPISSEITDLLPAPRESLESLYPSFKGISGRCGFKGDHICMNPVVEYINFPGGRYSTCLEHMMRPDWFQLITVARRISAEIVKLAEEKEKEDEAKKSKKAKKKAKEKAKKDRKKANPRPVVRRQKLSGGIDLRQDRPDFFELPGQEPDPEPKPKITDPIDDKSLDRGGVGGRPFIPKAD